MPNYDVLESKDSYHGTAIRSQIPSQLYKDNYDKIFGKKLDQEVAQDNALNSPEGTQNALEAG